MGNAATQPGLKELVYGLIKSNYGSAESPELMALPEPEGSPSSPSLRNWRLRSSLRCAPGRPLFPPLERTTQTPGTWSRWGDDRAAGPPPRGQAGKRRGRRSIPGDSGFGCRSAAQPCPQRQPMEHGEHSASGIQSQTFMSFLVLFFFPRKYVKSPLCWMSQHREKLVPVELAKREKEQLY